MKQTITTVGVIGTEPNEIGKADGSYVCWFRLASTVRGIDKETGQWVDKFTNWFSISIFGSLGRNAKKSFAKGDRIILQGRLRVNEWKQEEKSGTTVEIIADAIGPELLWGTSTFEKTTGLEGESDSITDQEEPYF